MFKMGKMEIKIIDHSNQFIVKIDPDKTIRQLKHKLAYKYQKFDNIDKIQLFNRKQELPDHSIIKQCQFGQFPELELQISQFKTGSQLLGISQSLSRYPTQLQKIEEMQGLVPKKMDNTQMNNQDDQRPAKHPSNFKNIRIKHISNTNKDNNFQIQQIDYNNNPIQINNQLQAHQLSLQKSGLDIRKQHIVIMNKNQSQRNPDLNILKHNNNNNDIFQSTFHQSTPLCVNCNLIIPGEITQLPCFCNYHGECFDQIVNKQLDQNNLKIVCYRCTKPIQDYFLSPNQKDRLEKIEKIKRQQRSIKFKH